MNRKLKNMREETAYRNLSELYFCRRIDKVRRVFVCTVECMRESEMVNVAHRTRVRSVCVCVCLFMSGYREDGLLIPVCIMLRFTA